MLKHGRESALTLRFIGVKWLFGDPSQIDRLAPFDSMARRNLPPRNRWNGLCSVVFDVEARLPSERARLYREGGTHYKSPQLFGTPHSYMITKPMGFGDPKATGACKS
jgi:hypothetical protein